MPTNVDTSLDAPEEQEPTPFPALSRQFSGRMNVAAANMALREHALADREFIAQQHFEVETQRNELNKIHMLTSLMQERQRISDSMEKQRQTMQFLGGLSKLTDEQRSDPAKFEHAIAELGAANPHATDNKFILDALQFHRKGFELKQAADIELDKRKQEQAMQTAGAVDREKQLMGPRAETAGKEEAAKEAARLQAKAANPSEHQDTQAKFLSNIKGYGLNLDDFENFDKKDWQPKPSENGKVFKAVGWEDTDKKKPNKFVTMQESHLNDLKTQYDALFPKKPQDGQTQAPAAGAPSTPTKAAFRFNPESGKLEPVGQ